MRKIVDERGGLRESGHFDLQTSRIERWIVYGFCNNEMTAGNKKPDML